MLKKLLKKKRFYVVALLIIALTFIYPFLELRMSDEHLTDELSNNPLGYEAQVSHKTVDNRNIRYVEIGADSLPLIVFIHGAPSSSSFWLSYMTDSLLLSKAKLLAIDRPGYGYSGFGMTVTSLKEQAKLVAPIIREKRKTHTKIIIHGSSYGGTLTARLAMDFPELMDGVIFQSASLAPGKETTYWLTYPTNTWPLKWLIPTTIRVANEEKLSHRLELKKMEPLWHKIKSFVTILHGEEDTLIYPENATYAKDKLINAANLNLTMAKNSGHDLAWTQRKLIIDSILEMLKFDPLRA